MATLRQVEYFSVTFGASTTATVTLSTTLLDTSKAFIDFGVETDGTGPAHRMVRGNITNTTTLTFTRHGTTGTPTVKGYCVEFTAGVTVDRGAMSSFGASEQTAALSNVTDLTKAFVIASGSNTGTILTADETFTARLFDSSGLKVGIESGENNTTFINTVEWQAIEYDDCSVQRGTFDTLGATASDTETLSPAVDLGKSFIKAYFQATDTSTYGSDDIGFQVAFDSTTQISATRATTDSDRPLTGGTWEVVSFTDATTVQEIKDTLASTVTSGTNALTTLSNSGNDAIAISGSMGGWAMQDTLSSNWGCWVSTGQITSATNLTVARGEGTGAQDSTYYVIDFVQAVVGTIDTPTGPVTIYQGDEVNFTSSVTGGNGSYTHSWTFQAGSGISEQTSADPGFIQFDNVGAWTVTYTASDTSPLADTDPPTVVVTTLSPPGEGETRHTAAIRQSKRITATQRGTIAGHTQRRRV